MCTSLGKRGHALITKKFFTPQRLKVIMINSINHMLLNTISLTLMILILNLDITKAKSFEKYGEPIKLSTTVTLEQAIANYSSSKNTQTGKIGPILIQSKVSSVCESKGCWIGLKSGAYNVRVTFKDYKYFVPISLRGKNVKIEGFLEEKLLTIEESKHYVKDAGGNPDQVTAPHSEYRIVASGIEVID